MGLNRGVYGRGEVPQKIERKIIVTQSEHSYLRSGSWYFFFPVLLFDDYRFYRIYFQLK